MRPGPSPHSARVAPWRPCPGKCCSALWWTCQSWERGPFLLPQQGLASKARTLMHASNRALIKSAARSAGSPAVAPARVTSDGDLCVGVVDRAGDRAVSSPAGQVVGLFVLGPPSAHRAGVGRPGRGPRGGLALGQPPRGGDERAERRTQPEQRRARLGRMSMLRPRAGIWAWPPLFQLMDEAVETAIVTVEPSSGLCGLRKVRLLARGAPGGGGLRSWCTTVS